MLVLYGGYNSAVPVSDLYEWDGTTGLWTARPPQPAPPPMDSHQMVYDEDTGHELIFGGKSDTSGTTPSLATYEYDGTSWITHAGGELSIDSATVGVYDAPSHRALLAGDIPAQGTGDALYQYDGATWSKLCDQCSGDPRNDGAMVYDRGWGKILWIGGFSITRGRLNTIAELDAANRWTTISMELPVREGWGVAYDQARDVVVLYGGWADADKPCSGTCDPQICSCSQTWEGLPIYAD